MSSGEAVIRHAAVAADDRLPRKQPSQLAFHLPAAIGVAPAVHVDPGESRLSYCGYEVLGGAGGGLSLPACRVPALHRTVAPAERARVEIKSQVLVRTDPPRHEK